MISNYDAQIERLKSENDELIRRQEAREREFKTLSDQNDELARNKEAREEEVLQLQ